MMAEMQPTRRQSQLQSHQTISSYQVYRNAQIDSDYRREVNEVLYSYTGWMNSYRSASLFAAVSSN